MNTDTYSERDPFGLEENSYFHITRRKTTIDLIKEYARDDNKTEILDVGCGTGTITRLIRDEFKNLQIDAFDISEIAIENAKSTINKVNFFVQDAYSFSSIKKYDVIILNNIYEHVENPVLLLKILKKVLKDDGIIIISTPNRYHIKNLFRCILGRDIIIPEYHITEYSVLQIYDHHKYCDLRIEKVLDPKIAYERFRLINFILLTLIQPIFNVYLKFVRSKNKSGSLLFFVSKKQIKT